MNRPKSLRVSHVTIRFAHANFLLQTIISVDGIDPADIVCTYSPAKRRGPTPGRAAHADGLTSPDSTAHATRHDTSSGMNGVGGGGNNHQLPVNWQQQILNSNNLPTSSSSMNHNIDMMNGMVTSNGTLANPSGATNMTPQQQQQLAAAAMMLAGSNNNSNNNSNNINLGGGMNGLSGAGNPMVGLAPTSSNDPSAIQYHLNLLQQQIQQRQQQLLMAQQLQHPQQIPSNFSNPGMEMDGSEPNAQRRRMVPTESPKQLPKTILTHTHMLDRGDPDGSRLRAYFRLSIDEMFRLPCTPSDDEYCQSTGQPLVGRHLAALSASRFAETALGAIVNNEITLAMELCNAVVHCLREAVEDPVDGTIVFEIAKAYFLLGVFRSIRGDMVRYFKYRRVALSYISKLKVTFFVSIHHCDACFRCRRFLTPCIVFSIGSVL